MLAFLSADKLDIMAMFSGQAHIRVVLLQQLSDGLKQGDQEISRLAQYPAWLSNKDTQEHSTHLQLTLPSCIRHCKVLRNLQKYICPYKQMYRVNNLHPLPQIKTKTHYCTFHLPIDIRVIFLLLEMSAIKRADRKSCQKEENCDEFSYKNS